MRITNIETGSRWILVVNLIIWLLSATVSAAADDEDVNYPILLTKSLFLDIAANGNMLVAVGEWGHILVSRNGRPWRSIQSPVASTLTAVYFYDDNHGWAVGHDAVILKTTDSGEHWRQVHYAPEEETPLLDVWFENEHHGIAIGAYGLYLTTNDGGNTWHREEMNVVDDQPETEINEKADDLTELYDLHLNAFTSSPGGDLYIVAEAGRIYKSGDDGHNWHELKSPYIGSLFGVLVPADGSLLVFGLRGHLYRSDDDGTSWREIKTHTREMLTHGELLDNGKVIIVGMGGSVLVSDDQGITFIKRDLGHRNSYAAVAAYNKNVIMVGDHGIEKYSYHQLGLD
jgi:photosystem II stability/assembly factor-like uncharacterized protein